SLPTLRSFSWFRFFGRVLSVLSCLQLLCRLIAAAWPRFPLPPTGWNHDGRPENLLLSESAVSRLRPSRPGQPARLLPQRTQPTTPCPGVPHLPETLLRTQRH